MCGCLLCTPNWGPGLQLRHVSWLGIEPVTFCFCRPELNPLSHTSQSFIIIFLLWQKYITFIILTIFKWTSSIVYILVSVLQRERADIYTHTYILYIVYGFVMRNWLTWLWRLRSLTICHLQAGDPGDVIWTKSKGLRTRGANRWNPSVREGEDEVGCLSLSSEAGKRQTSTSSTFCSVQALNWLEGAHPHWVYQFKCWSLPEMPSQTYQEIIFNLGTPWPVQLTHTVYPHKWYEVHSHYCLVIHHPSPELLSFQIEPLDPPNVNSSSFLPLATITLLSLWIWLF